MSWTAIPMTLATRLSEHRIRFFGHSVYMGLVAMQAGVMVSFSEDDLEQFYLADLLTMVINQLITATILQV